MERERKMNLVLGVVLGLTLIWAVAGNGGILTERGLFAHAPQPSARVEALQDSVQLVDYSLSEADNHLVKGEFVIDNQSTQALRNFSIHCDFYDLAGNYVDRDRWLLHATVAAGASGQLSLTERRFIHSQSAEPVCVLVDFSPVTAPAFSLHRSAGTHDAAGHAPAGDHVGAGSHGQASPPADAHGGSNH